MLLGQALDRLATPAALAEAATLLQAVSQFCASCPEGAAMLAGHLALRARARIESGRGAFREAAQLWEELGRRVETMAARLPEDDPLEPILFAISLCYTRRAAELWDARQKEGEGAAESFARARGLYRRLCAADPTDGVLALSLCRLLLQRGAAEEAAAVLDAHARAAANSASGELIRAARAAEAVRDARAAERWLEVVALDRPALEALCRLHRRRADRPRVCATYGRFAALRGQAPALGPASAPAQRRAATYLQAAAALALEALPTRDAEALWETAAQDEEPPGGPLLPLCRVVLLRKLGRHADHAAALQAAIERVSDLNTQADLYRHLAAEAIEHLGDPHLARKSYEHVLEIRPGDVVALHALARLSIDLSPTQAALYLRQAIDRAREVDLEGPDALHQGDRGKQAAALLLCELAALHRQGGAGMERDPARAISCYEEALRLDPRCAPAALGLLETQRGDKSAAEQLATLARAVPLCRDERRRLDLLLDLARTAESMSQSEEPDATPPPGPPPAEQALSAYTDALRLALSLPGAQGDHGDSEAQGPARPALDGLTRMGRRLGRWQHIYDALHDLPAPRPAFVLPPLCDAAEHLERYQDLARFREEELAALRDPAAILRAAQALSDLYEQRLQQPDAAARVWERAFTADPDGALALEAAPAALERLYTASNRFQDLATLWRKELARLAAQAPAEGEDEARRARRRELLLRLGALCRDQLAAPGDAIAAFEAVLASHPDDPVALQALAGLYSESDRSDELRRVLELRVKSARDPEERARVLLQAGEVAEKSGDLEVAESSYQEAFALDVSSRAVFTALERVLYRRERWTDVMKMYDAALHHVLKHKGRAYRAGDLYARRGQVLMQYLARPDEAAVEYGKAMEADPDNDSTQAALERIHAAENRWPALIAVYERRAQLVRDDAKRVEILRRAARVAAAKLRDIPEAIRLFQRLHTVDPTDSEALDTLERHYERGRDWEHLMGLLGTRLALSQDEAESVQLNMRMGLICEEGLRDHDRAIECYTQALEHQPNHREALDALARLYEANERWAELVEISRRQIRLTTDRSQKALLYFKCGSVMEAKFSKEDDAIRYYEAAVKTSPSCLPAVHGLRDIYLRREDWPRVTQTLELEAKLWTEDKERAGIYAHIGQIYREKLGDQERAIQYYESALAVDRECLPANRALFDVFYQRGDWVRAVPMGQVLSAKANREGDPQERSDFYRKRAVVADHINDLRTAAESLVVALEIDPENMDALELLVSLCRRDPGIYDFAAVFRELEKLYRRRQVQRGLALSLVARAILAERAYDVEAAEELLDEAVRLCPGEFIVVEALVALNERLRRFGPARAALSVFIETRLAGEQTEATAIAAARAQLRLAEMYSEAALDSEAAVRTLAELCQRHAAGGAAPGSPLPPPDLMRVARFRLVQELFVLGRYPQARAEMQALIDEAVRPPSGAAAGSVAPPEELSRYYDYLGRILEVLGEGQAAQRTYRRALDLDPAHALPVMALARRAARAGDRPQAELLMREALSQATSRGDPAEELRLRRGIARLLSAVDPAQAIEAYRQAIERATAQLSPDAAQAATAAPDYDRDQGPGAKVVARETLDDRVALADLLLQQGEVTAAHDELLRVLQRDLRYAPAYRLLATAYERLGAPDRAGRVAAVLGLLGYSDPTLGELLRGAPHPSLRRGALTDELRGLLLLPALRGPYMELVQAISEALGALFPPPWPLPPGSDVAPAQRVADAGFKVCMADVARLYGIDAEVLVARGVPGGILAVDGIHLPGAGGRPLLVLESSLLDRPEGDRRFLLGRGYEALRGGYALLLSLRPGPLAEVARLLEQLLLPDERREPGAQEFARALPRKAQKGIDRLVGAETRVSAEAFLAALPLCADRGGLLNCDDIGASIRMLARLQGEELAFLDRDRDAVLLGQVVGGAELIRYFLSDSYHDLREALREGSRL
jgi:tetratricopeptide (TPR) repeat protein